MTYTAVQVFSATKSRDREALGERITHWLRGPGRGAVVIEKVVRQSSDREFHCLSVLLFYRWPRRRTRRQ